MQWFKNVCRLCGLLEEISYDIYSDDSLPEKIKKCLKLEISKDDFKPKQMCQLCYKKINEFSSFVDTCYATNFKFESACYTEPWYYNNDRIIYDSATFTKKSVIVTNRQSHDASSQFNEETSDETMILPNYNLNQSDSILDFSINYNNDQADEIQTCFSQCDNFDKTDNLEFKEKGTIENENMTNSCLVHENDPGDLLDSVGNNTNPLNREITGRILVSVDEVRKSLEANNLMNTTNSESSTKKTYLCPHCEKVFMRRSNLNAHISVHTKIRPYKCSTCAKTFAIKCHLTQHKKTHLDIFSCQICHKNFDVPSKLSRHIQTHSKNKPFICNVLSCGKKFTDKDNLKQHILNHSSEKNFSCDICSKEFKTRKNLKAHNLCHINHKFQCSFCQKDFKYKHNLRKHVVKHNGLT